VSGTDGAAGGTDGLEAAEVEAIQAMFREVARMRDARNVGEG